MEGLQYPSKYDVLCGRGGKINEHAGNCTFRATVEQYKERYNLESNKVSKASISRDIVGQINAKGGRFLKKDAVTGLWFEADLDHSLKKTSQALREGAPKIRARAVREGKMKANPASASSSKKKATITTPNSMTRTFQRQNSAVILPSLYEFPGVSSFDYDALGLYNANADMDNFFNDTGKDEDNFKNDFVYSPNIKTNANDDGDDLFHEIDPLFVTPSSTPPLQNDEMRDDYHQFHRKAKFRRMNSLATSDLASDDSYMNEVALDPFGSMNSDDFAAVKMVEL